MTRLIDNVLSSLEIPVPLNGKWALITGASSGIGLATAVLLAKEGVNLILVARRKERLEKIQAELEQEFSASKVRIVVADVTAPDFIDKLRSENALSIDILINNAGLALTRTQAIDALADDVDIVLNTNINAVFKLSGAVGRQMVKKGEGHIFHIGSIAGHYTYDGGSIYCASKFAVRAFSQTMRQELYDKNVKVTLVSPGMVKTEFSLVRFKGDSEKADKVYANADVLKASDVGRVIVKVLCEPAHVNLDEIIIMPVVQSPVTYQVVRHTT